MRIAFYKGRKTVIDKLICFFSRGKYSHCEIMFSDSKCFASSQRDGGCRFTNIEFNPDHWDFVGMDLDYEQETKIRVFCEAQRGRGYDYLGVLGFVLPIRQNKRRWFCAEVTVAAIQQCGWYWWVTPEHVSPNSLYLLLTGQDVPHQENR